MGLLQFGIALFVLAISLWSLFSFDACRAGSQEPLLINQIAIDPSNPRIVYAAARPQGLLKTTDRGESWRPARTGLTNTSGYYIVINPLNPKILYLGTFGGGIYKSEDGAERWFEVNQGLGNTNIHALALNPLQPDQLIVSTSTGELYRSNNGGGSWASFNEGLPPFPGEVFSSLLIFPGDPGGFFLAQEKLFRRPFSSPMWQAVEQSLSDQVITALAYDPRGRILYAGTLKAGLFQTTLKPHSPATNPVSFQSRLTWEAIGRPFQKEWVRLIALDPSNPTVLYASVVNRGLFKSTNQGVAWQEINVGLPEKMVESLAIDPADPKRLYAGTHNHGLFFSIDGGHTWRPPATVDLEPVQQIIASLASQSTTAKEQAPRSEPPPAFAKCNQCHGWTDPGLNQKATFWRVAPNRRDWRPTVTRMSQGAGLAPEEEEEIIRFLTAYSQPGAAADEEKEGPFVIHEIALNPQQSHILYAVTSNYGILQSADGGATWRLRNEGLQSYTHHAIAVHPLTPAILYAGAWGGGVTKSLDGGDHWAAVNDSLGNTAIEDLVLDPSNPEQLYVATTTGVFKSPDGGARWMPWSEGLPVSVIEIFECLLALPTGATELLLGTSRGLYQRGSNSPQWEVVSGGIAGEQITALAFHPKGGLLYAGTRRNGLFKSSDEGKSWVPSGEPIKRAWVSDIALDPQHPEIIYVATRGDGIFKSVDGETTWRSINQGLPVSDIRSLAIDPQHPAMLYAGTTHHGLLKSSDSGNRWVQLAGYPRFTHTEVVGALSGPDRLKEELSSLAVPPEFSKCNQCHGWADPFLNLKQTYWRVPPNRRDWGPTITRMSVRAQLTQEESSKILEFLNAYTTASVSAGGQMSEQEIVRQRCSHCHALQVMEDCVAGDCRGSRVVRLLKPPPWDFVVDWMHSMGAEMTETEQQAILGYLERSYPATPYPIQWVKVPASLGKGGWNVVSLKEYAGYLYVGLEGNGKIFRSHDGTRWQEVADTDRHTVYGITVFQGALYAGTNDPNPEIWKSADGVNWALEARLPPEDHGVISLSVFKDDLYAGTARAWIYRSRDGRRWEKVADLQQVTTAAYVRWVRFLLPFQEHLYAGLEKGPVYRTSNGRDWEPIPQSITEQVGARGAAVFQSALYMGTTGAGTIWRTTDGVRWEQVFTAPTHVRRGYVAAMAVAADHLYGSVDGYLFRTRDGEHWEEIGHLGPYTLEALAAWDQSLYVGTLIPPQALLYRAALQP